MGEVEAESVSPVKRAGAGMSRGVEAHVEVGRREDAGGGVAVVLPRCQRGSNEVGMWFARLTGWLKCRRSP